MKKLLKVFFMPYFNVIDCLHSTYRLIWNERAYLLKLAAIPFLIKFAFFMLAGTYGESGNFIRYGLFMVPAYFAEGWMLCHFIRLISDGQRWPYQMTGDEAEDLKAVRHRAKPLLAGVVGFVLINLGIALYHTAFMSFVPEELLTGGEVDPNELPPETAMIIIFMFAFMVAAFKYVWLYIAMAAGISPKTYADTVRGFGHTIRLIGLWILCFIPIMFLTQFLVASFLSGGSISASGQIIVSFLTVILDTLKNLIVTVGMAIAILKMVNGRDKGMTS